MVNCNLGQNKMEQKTPLTLAAQTPPPPHPLPLRNQGLKPREHRNRLYI